MAATPIDPARKKAINLSTELSTALPRQSAPAPRSRSLAALTSFWRWWIGELVACLPQSWVQVVNAGSRGPLLCIDGNDVVLVEPAGANLRELGRVTVAGLDQEAARNAVQKLLGQHKLTGAEVRLGLDRAICLMKTIELPLATEENLQGVLAFELDRYTPFKAEHANFASRVIKRDAERGRMFVQLAVAPRSAVRALLERVKAWGIEPTAAIPEADAGHAGPGLDVLGGDRNETRFGSGVLDPLTIGLSILFMLLLGVALILPVWQKREAAKALNPKVGVARQQAGEVDRLRKDLDGLLAEANFVLAKKHTNPPLSLMVEDLSRVFPDTTWVQVMEVKTGGKMRELILTGETASPSKLVETMEQIPYLTNPAFRSPLTKGGAPGSERFVLAAEIKSRPLPPSVAPGPVPPVPAQSAAPAAAPAPAPAAQPGGTASSSPPAKPAPPSAPAAAPATVTVPPQKSAAPDSSPKAPPTPPAPGPGGKP